MPESVAADHVDNLGAYTASRPETSEVTAKPAEIGDLAEGARIHAAGPVWAGIVWAI